MKAFIRPLIMLTCLIPCLPLHSQPTLPEPNWDRAVALQTVRETDTKAILKSLYQMARSGRNGELMDSLSAIGEDPGMPGPTKDYLVFSFTLGLSDLDANAVNHQVLNFLSTYKARTLVAHDEHPAMAVPLFNIRAAASGVRNRWDRQQASVRAEILLPEPPDQWLVSYLAANPVERRGFVDALEFATPGQLHSLGGAALDHLDEKPELTLITARAGLDSGDLELLRQSISRGGGPDLPGILKAASTRLSDKESIDLLIHSLQFGSDSSAALAIAQLAPAQLDKPEVRDLLFSTLQDRGLGASAALVLGASPDPEIQDRLRKIASDQGGLAAQRAALAISIHRSGREDVL